MKLESVIGRKVHTDFGNPLNEEAIQFMMEHFGFPNTDHMSDEECREFGFDLHRIEAYEHIETTEGIDENDPNNYDEGGLLMIKPLSEYGLMIAGMIVYIFDQYKEGGSRYKPPMEE